MAEKEYERVEIDDVITDARQREALADLNEAWGPEKARFETASKLAIGLLALFGFIVVSSGIVTMILSIRSEPVQGLEQMQDFFNTLLPYIATPLGIALGYFFRESRGG